MRGAGSGQRRQDRENAAYAVRPVAARVLANALLRTPMQLLFADDDAVAQWELELLPLRGIARLPLLLPLAWHLRQRDGKRAQELAREAAALLPAAQLPDDARA